jgi:hypothetical protein
VQAKVDAAIDKAIAKIVALVKKLFGGGGAKGADTRTPQQKDADLRRALADANRLMEERKTKPSKIRSKLSSIKSRYRLTKLTLDDAGENKFRFHAEINPAAYGPHKKIHDLDAITQGASADAKKRLKAHVDSAANEQEELEKLRKALADKTDLPKRKTIAQSLGETIPGVIVTPGGDVTISGWGPLETARIKLVKGRGLVLSQNVFEVHRFIKENAAGLATLDYEPRPFFLDLRGIDPVTGEPTGKGSYYESHAEKQALVPILDKLAKMVKKAGKLKGPPPRAGEGVIVSGAVSRDVCAADCFPFMRAAARLTRATIVLADPQGVWIFQPNGKVALKLPDPKKPKP